MSVAIGVVSHHACKLVSARWVCLLVLVSCAPHVHPQGNTGGSLEGCSPRVTASEEAFERRIRRLISIREVKTSKAVLTVLGSLFYLAVANLLQVLEGVGAAGHYRLLAHCFWSVILGKAQSCMRPAMAAQHKQKQSNEAAMASTRRRNSLPYKYQLAVLGASRVGKSALVKRWMTPETFVETHYETVDHSYEKTVRLDMANSRAQVQVVDTSGSHCFPAMRKLLARETDGFLLVFDIHDRDSFAKVKEMKQEIEQMRRVRRIQHCEVAGSNITSPMPAVLVANKTDGDDTDATLSLRQEAKELARQLGYGYVETSAKENRNITEIFRCLIARVQKSFALDLTISTKTNAKKSWKSVWNVFG